MHLLLTGEIYLAEGERREGLQPMKTCLLHVAAAGVVATGWDVNAICPRS